MSRKFKCIRAWTRHSLGQVIEEYEYRRCPAEIKGHFVEIDPELPVAESAIPEVAAVSDGDFVIVDFQEDLTPVDPIEEPLEDFVAERIPHPTDSFKEKTKKKKD